MPPVLAAITAHPLCPVNGECPVSMAKSTPPSAYRSERASPRSAMNCSGAAYSKVATGARREECTTENCRACTRPAIPKSTTFADPAAVTITFCGLMS